VEQNAEDAKTAEGGDTVAAADDAAQTTADDLGLGIEEIGNEFYGVDLEQAAADFYTQFEPTVAAALETDPTLIAFGSPADLVSGDAMTADDAAAVDDAMGALAPSTSPQRTSSLCWCSDRNRKCPYRTDPTPTARAASGRQRLGSAVLVASVLVVAGCGGHQGTSSASSTGRASSVAVSEVADDTQYRDSAVLVTLKALQEAGQLLG
jgi:hypothetical protein